MRNIYLKKSLCNRKKIATIILKYEKGVLLGNTNYNICMDVETGKASAPVFFPD